MTSGLSRRCLFAGVDAGASKTLAIVVDTAGREVGRALAGSANYQAIGLERALAHLRQALGKAADTAGAQLPLAAACIGMAGIDRPTDSDTWLPHLRPLAGAIHLTNDAELALSALDGAVGVAIIAGTGSIALGRDPRGATARTGGWGHLLGDEGSGYDIGRQALQAATRAADGRGPQTTLLALIVRRWHLQSPSDILGQVYPARGTARIAQLSSLVFAAARAGDRVARAIVARAAGEIAQAALVAGDTLQFPDGRLPLALAGGLLVNETAYRAQVLRRIRRRRATGQVVVVAEPALSAARAATRLLEVCAQTRR
jgi:N-acetylglucosamine kinase-like BadF-type ATPase